MAQLPRYGRVCLVLVLLKFWEWVSCSVLLFVFEVVIHSEQ